MKDFSHYKKHIEIDMVKYSGSFHFKEQLRQEGTDIKINEKSTQLIDNADKTIRAIVRNSGVENKESDEERSLIIGKEYTYKCGDYVEYLEDTYLTIASVDKDNPFFNTTKMKRVNYILKFMSEGVLYKLPVIVTNQTKYTLGVESKENVGITEENSRFAIQGSYNEISKKILSGHRFILNDQAWRVTQRDHITTPNVLNMLLGQTAINYETDDVKNEIAGVYENKHTYTWTLPTSTIEVTNGSNYTLSYSIVDETGKEVDYNLVTTKSSNNSLISITKNNKDIIIKGLSVGTGIITLDLPVGETVEEKVINFEVKDVVIPKTEYQIVPPSNGTTLKLMSSSTFVFKQFVGGTENTSLNVGFGLDSVGQNLVAQKKLSVTQKTSNSYLVKNLNCSVLTSFTITFTNSSNSDVISTQVVTLRGV